MKRVTLVAIAFVVLGELTIHAQTPTVPDLINYQGKLSNIEGVPLPSGNYTMEFNLYAVRTGGTAVWGPLQFDNGSGDGHGPRVSVANGFFNVFLGPRDTASRAILNAFATKDLYLGIKVTTGTSLTGVAELIPRQQILSSPYAMHANSLGGGRAYKGASDQIVVNTAASIGSGYVGTAPPTNGLIIEGNVGIGVTGPAEKLEVNGRIKDKTGFVAPVGAIMAFAGITPPAGWLLCDGAAVSRTGTYADLYGVIGTLYGAGNGSTTFNVPNLKGRFPAGFDTAQSEFNAIAKTGGEKTHTLSIAEMPSHSHTWLRGNEGDDSGFGGSYNEFTDAPGSRSDVIQATGGGGAHNTLPPFLVIHYIIKY